MNRQLVFSIVFVAVGIGAAIFIVLDLLPSEIANFNPVLPVKDQPFQEPQDGGRPSDEDSNAPQGGRSYENQKHKFKIAYPEGWTPQENIATNIAVVLFSPKEGPEDGYGENVLVKVRELSATSTPSPQEITDSIIREIQQSVPEGAFNLVSRDSVLLSGFPADRVVYTLANAINKRTTGKALSVTTVKNLKGYIIIYSAKEETYKNFSEDVNFILNSFRLQD